VPLFFESDSSKGGAGGGAETKKLRKIGKKIGARLASPQPRPASPVNGAGGITGCTDDAQAQGSFQREGIFSFFCAGGVGSAKPWGFGGVVCPIAEAG
jgi:hypothetical protein